MSEEEPAPSRSEGVRQLGAVCFRGIPAVGSGSREWVSLGNFQQRRFRDMQEDQGSEAVSGQRPSKGITLDAVMPEMYAELHRLATSYMRGERESHTLQPTALVNETYLKLMTQHSVDFGNRAQVLGVAAQMMRRILRHHAEKRDAEKRGGGVTVIGLGDSPEPRAANCVPFDAVDQLLDRLAALNERQAKVAECRIFGGLTLEETGKFLNISEATAHRDWTCGRLWLARELRPSRA